MAMSPQIFSAMQYSSARYQIIHTIKDQNTTDSSTGETHYLKSAQEVLLIDGANLAIILIPSSHMLDIAKLNTYTNKLFRPLKQKEYTALLEKLEAEQVGTNKTDNNETQVQAQHFIADYIVSTYIDNSINSLTHIVLESSQSNQLQCIETSALKEFSALFYTGDFTQPLVDTTQPKLELTKKTMQSDVNTVHQAISRFTSMRIRQCLDDILEMPPLPCSVRRIIDLRTSNSPDLEQLTHVVKCDPALSAQIISWANASADGAIGTASCVRQAIVDVLGFDLVVNLTMGLSVGKQLEVAKNYPELLSGYHDSAILCAEGAAKLASLLPKEHAVPQQIAYLAGLLHNFGLIILSQVFPSHFQLVIEHALVNSHLKPSEVEKKLLWITREEICSQLLKNWGIDEAVYTAILHQCDSRYQGKYWQLTHLLIITQRQIARQSSSRFYPKKWSAVQDDHELYDRLGLSEQEAALCILDTLRKPKTNAASSHITANAG